MSLPVKSSRPLSPDFFLRSSPVVARDLLGKGLYVRNGRQEFLVEITEVEAYLGGKDPASHAYRGVTERNWPMFEEGGTCYVYLSYGMHCCMNVATGKKGVGEAILFRAAAPILGTEAMSKNRKLTSMTPASQRNLLSGPGKLCQALGVDRSFNGRRFDRDDFKLVDIDKRLARSAIGSSGRIGITKAVEDELRFFIRGSPWLSRREAT